MNGFTLEQIKKFYELKELLNDFLKDLDSVLTQNEKRDIDTYYSRSMFGLVPKRTIMIYWCILQVEMALAGISKAIQKVNDDKLYTKR